MIEVLETGLSSVVNFKKARAVLNQNALTFIRGVNLDSDPATPTGNGTGKSLFFSALPTVAFASPPTSTKKKAKKEVLNKGSEFHVKLKASNGGVYDIHQSSTKYKIFKNGIDTEIRTTPLAEAEIRETIFPLTEIEYYSHGYVSTLRPYLMRSDNDSNRLEHLSSIFRLDDYSTLRSFFATKLRSVKDNEVRVAVLEQKSLTLKDKIKRVKALLAESTLDAARKEHKTLDKAIEALVGIEYETLQTRQQLKTLSSIESELDELRSQYKSKLPPKAYHAWLKGQKALVKQAEEYAKLYKAYKKNTQSLQEKIDSIKTPSKDVDAIKKKRKSNEKLLAQLEPELEELQDKEKAFNRISARAEEAIAKVRSYGDDARGVDTKIDYTAEIEGHKTSLRLQDLLEHAHDEDNKCPTCLSDIDVANIRKVVERAKKKLPQLKRLVEIQTAIKNARAIQQECKGISFNEKRLNEVKLSVKLSHELIEGNDDQLRVWKKLADLKETLAEIKAPKKPAEQPESDLSYADLDAQMEMCNAIMQHVQSRTKLLENNPELGECRTVKLVKARIVEVDDKLKELGLKLKTSRTRLGVLSALIEKQSNLESELSLYQNEQKEVVAEIIKIKPDSDDKAILDVLVKAYSTKGLKTIVANKICTLLQTNLNLYRPLIFVEPFSFSIHASETGLSIQVDRGNGVPMGDVRNLSGAESNCFNLLFLLSLLPLIPEPRRLSMVILDEPTAHCDAVTRQLFLNSFLPALCEVVPNVYVITNHPDDHKVGSHEWVVVKKKGVSTLITNQLLDGPVKSVSCPKKGKSKTVKKQKRIKH